MQKHSYLDQVVRQRRLQGEVGHSERRATDTHQSRQDARHNPVQRMLIHHWIYKSASGPFKTQGSDGLDVIARIFLAVFLHENVCGDEYYAHAVEYQGQQLAAHFFGQTNADAGANDAWDCDDRCE